MTEVRCDETECYYNKAGKCRAAIIRMSTLTMIDNDKPIQQCATFDNYPKARKQTAPTPFSYNNNNNNNDNNNILTTNKPQTINA